MNLEAPQSLPRPRHFLREWRKHRRLTQEQLGERIAVSASNISLIENGKQNYTQRILEDMAVALETIPASLLARHPSDPEGIWTLAEKILSLSPAGRRQAIAILDTFAKTGTNQ